MTDNITALIAEARKDVAAPYARSFDNGELFAEFDFIRRLADALEAEHKRTEEAEAEVEGMLSDSTRWMNRALPAEAERDRYRAEAESARKTGERILSDALRYRAAIEEATKVLHLDAERELHDIREILTRALNEGAADV